MPRKLLCLLILICITICARAQSPAPPLPALYKNVDSLLWVTRDADALLDAWSPLGLTLQDDFHDVPLDIIYRGQPTHIRIRHVYAHLDNLALEIVQPQDTTPSAFLDFLTAHGDGIFAVLFPATPAQLQQETTRLHALGVNVLQQYSAVGPIHWTLFDTEPQGKYVLGLITHPGPTATQPPSSNPITVTHTGLLVRDPNAVAAFWHRLGFPTFSVGSEPQRDDFLYRGQPLHLNFGTAAQPFAQLTFEWIRADSTPPNLYADFYASHHNQEGIQHLGFGVRNLPSAIALFQKAGFTPTQSGHWVGPNNHPLPYTSMEGPPTSGGIQAELVQTN